MTSGGKSPVETVLRDELARADRALNGVAPVLGHLLADEGNALVSDAVVAQVRGMIGHIAQQMVQHLPGSQGLEHGVREGLAADAPILQYVHAVAVEALLTRKLDQRSAIDPVLSPLMQELIASRDPATGELAMKALAAQSRFVQSQRRMQLPLGEVPAEMLERCLAIWAQLEPADRRPQLADAVRAIKSGYDEATTRAGLLGRLVATMGNAAIAAVQLEHGGLALFASALARLSGQSRERAVLACHDRQAARLALGLRAAGMEADGIARQFAILEPSARLPHSLDDLSVEAARALVRGSGLTPPQGKAW